MRRAWLCPGRLWLVGTASDTPTLWQVWLVSLKMQVGRFGTFLVGELHFPRGTRMLIADGLQLACLFFYRCG